MPYIVQGEPSSWKDIDYSRKEYDYEYPYGLDLKPDSEFHKNLRNKIWSRARESRSAISKRYPSWRKIDETLTSYIPLKDYEESIKKNDPTKPVSIVFPYTYATLESLLTYLSLAFFQDPIFQYEGVEADDTVGAMLLELVISLHCVKSKVQLAIYTVLRDALCYGVGIGVPGWTVRKGKRAVRSDVITDSELGEDKQSFVNFISSTIYEGNDLSNIDPYMWLPDPSVSSDKIQDGEFVGWIERDNLMNLLTEERDQQSGLFNVKYLRQKKDRRSVLSKDQSERETVHGGSTDLKRGMSEHTNPVDIINMYINLIPKEWKLGESEYPEKWFFSLSSDDVITACEPAQHNHGMYPIAVASPEFDGYSTTPLSKLEVLYGMQGILDFLFNSHVSNVKKAVNDMLVVDPYLVNINDLKDPEPGKLIRLRRPAWGRGVDKVVQQLGINDVTQANVADAAYITQMFDRISGSDQSMQGNLRMGGPERLTKGEFQGTRGSAVSRLQRMAMLVGLQFMQDIGEMFAVHTQQYMSEESVVRITGRYADQLKQTFDSDRVKVSPHDLAVSYDLLIRDGSVPGGNFSDAWIQLFQIIGTSPELINQFDVTKIFTYIAQQLGAKNVEDFRRKVDNSQATTMPDEQVQREAQAGNLIPTGQV